ncbi:MAG: adenylate/guanylate cyclase domain-containing protein [Bacillota bacterium]|nr:adenylate/guanylate cyclase domain-containing protein [Bacillota bacterium]
MRQKILASAVIGLFTFGVVFFGWFGTLNLTLQDEIYQRPGSADGDIKIIAIDEKTLEALGQFETWTREPYAELIDTLNQGENKPRAIGLDILMIQEKGEEDALLTEACREAGNVVLAENLVFSEKIQTKDGRTQVNRLHIDMVEEPFAALSQVVDAGFANTVQDSLDSTVRYTFLEMDGYKSFAVALAEKAGVETDVSQTDNQNGVLIDYVGGAESYETLSMIDVLEGRIPPEAFADSIVLIGAHAAGMGDSYYIPGHEGQQMYGVEIHANVLQGLMEERFLTQAGALANGLCCGLIAFLLVLLCGFLKLAPAILVSAAVPIGQILLCLKLDETGFVINMIALPLAAVLAILWTIGSKYAVEKLQKRKILHAFQKYVAPQVVESLSKDQNFQLRLGGEKRQIAVLFVDIRGFTSMSEILTPEQVVEVLNEYFRIVTDAVFRHGGMIDKFIGDAAMAVFNAPVDCEDYIYRAVCTAQDIAAGSGKLAEDCQKRFGRSVSYGIGVNCGEAVVGNIGSDFRMDYTAIGDTVNTAARLESAAGSGQVYLSKEVCQALQDRISQGHISVEDVGMLELKGKAEPVMVYQLKEVKE